MSKSVQNVKKSVVNIFSASSNIISTSAELLADTTGLVSSSVGATPAVMKALLQSPFAAAKGYLMESEGLTEEQAELVAYHYIRQNVATTVTEASESAGKLMASFLVDDEDIADTKQHKEEAKAS